MKDLFPLLGLKGQGIEKLHIPARELNRLLTARVAHWLLGALVPADANIQRKQAP